MKPQLKRFAMVLALSSLITSMSHASTLDGSDYDFTPPAFPHTVGGQVFQHYLPAADGFAANVNLQIQPFEGSMDEYIELSNEQFEQLDFAVVDMSRGDNEVIYEYRGRLQNTDLHWYSRVIKQGNYYYVVTATALESRWDTERDQLIDSVNSFSLR